MASSEMWQEKWMCWDEDMTSLMLLRPYFPVEDQEDTAKLKIIATLCHVCVVNRLRTRQDGRDARRSWAEPDTPRLSSHNISLKLNFWLSVSSCSSAAHKR
jgi:hypothetical protein